MRMLALITSVALTAASALTAAAVEVQLVSNGGFEAAERPTGWGVTTWRGAGQAAIDADVAHSGERSLRLTGETEDGTVVAQQSIGLLTRGPLRLTGFWRSDVTEGTGARVILRWTDDSGGKLHDEDALTGDDPFDWQAFELTATPPDAAAGAIVFLEIWESAGSVCFDDLSATQSIETLEPAAFKIGRSPELVTVGVFDANAAGGRGFGAQGIHDVLSAADGVRSELITDLSLAALGRFDCVVLPNVHHWGGAAAPGALRRLPDLAWAGDPRACLRAYLRMGGGLVLTHQSNGTSPALSPSIVPQVVTVPDKTFEVTPAETMQHPVTEGIEALTPTFSDARILQPGPAAEVLMRNASGEALVVAGQVGAGRVVGVGLCPGIDPEEQAVAVSAGEAWLLENAVRWAAAQGVRPYALVVAPDIIDLRVPEDDMELTLTVLPTSDEAPERVALSVGLLDEQLQAVGEVDPVRVAAAMGESVSVVLEADQLADGTYYPAVRPPDSDRPEVVATVQNHAGLARFADSLPKPDFEWTCMNVHGPGGLKTEEEIAEMARRAREMNFDAVLFAAKPPNAYLYYNTQIGEKAPGFEDIDPLGLAVKHCHAQDLQLLVQFCTFREGSAENPSRFMREHPEWADWNPGDGPDLSQHQHGVFGCPDRPEVRQYELSLMREMAENYDIDGFSFDYIRYKNDRWCVCPFSQQHFQQWWEQHPDLGEAEARAKHAEEQIVSFTWEVREMLDEVKPEAILHGYCHPTWANRFPLQYLSFRASAHWTQPGRGGPWSLHRVLEASERNVELADDHVDFMQAAPMADTGYLPHEKPPERFRRELRLIGHAGAPAVMIYLYSTLRHAPELRQVIGEELAD
ncbi:MAG: family 10 glycosylhydrolase [Armatimonadota bacterium]|nr:family 10 glycosylhydrolase [Armatimonadota bacterium]